MKNIGNTTADKIRQYLVQNKIPFKANDNISGALKVLGVSKDQLIDEVESAFKQVLHNLVIDYDNDHNSKDTARRYAKMVVNETFSGRYDEMPDITTFPNVTAADQIILVRDIQIESVCAHHHQNISGRCHIAILPSADGGEVMGLSKYARLARWVARRPQIQEELTVNIANCLAETLQPRGVAVILDCVHYCMKCRGVMEPNSSTLTSHIWGEFRHNPMLRSEMYSLLNLRG